LSGFFNSKVGYVPFEYCERLGRPSTGSTEENLGNVRKIINEDQ
jgi:hypothetical protein